MTKTTTRPLAAFSALFLTVVLFAQTYAVPPASARTTQTSVVMTELA